MTGDTPGHIDPDETEPEPTSDYQTATLDIGTYREEAPSDVGAGSGFISGGLTTAESVALVCLSFGAYGLAVVILQAMLRHGLHHTPPLLWTLLTFLVLLPLIFTVGAAGGVMALDELSTAKKGAENESPHDREGDSG